MSYRQSQFIDPLLRWQDHVPQSTTFSDKYFVSENTLAENRHVFLNGIGAPGVWQNKADFTIFEAGFGTGVNFLNTWVNWKQSASPSFRLHYLAVEAFPLTADDILKATRPFDELGNSRQQLAENLPPLHPGYHRLVLDRGRVRLTLLYGDILDMLETLSPETQFDGCYLDGFAQTRNPEMWTAELFKLLSRHAKPGAGLATYSSATKICDALNDAGIIFNTRPGLMRRRDCLQGTFPETAAKPSTAPWFSPPPPQPRDTAIAIIGAGIGGAAMAYALRQSGADVTIFDQQNGPAAGASGNPVGILHPRLTTDNSAPGQFHAGAYLHTLNTLDALTAQGFKVRPGDEKGLLALPLHDRDARRQRKLADTFALPGSHMEFVLKQHASKLAGIDINADALWFKGAGCIDPKIFCTALIGDTPLRANCFIEHLQKTDDGWALFDGQGTCVMETPLVILANGLDCNRLLPGDGFPVNPKRGQISYLEPDTVSKNLLAPVTFGGYITPAFNGNTPHIIGATFEDWPDGLANDSWPALQQSSHQCNLDLLAEKIPALAPLCQDLPNDGRASLRATTADRLVIAGAVPDEDFYQHHYTDLHHGKAASDYPPGRYQPGLYCLTGLGSRGFQTALLAAEAVVATLFATPAPVAEHLMHAIHPARFIARDLKKQ